MNIHDLHFNKWDGSMKGMVLRQTNKVRYWNSFNPRIKTKNCVQVLEKLDLKLIDTYIIIANLLTMLHVTDITELCNNCYECHSNKKIKYLLCFIAKNRPLNKLL